MFSVLKEITVKEYFKMFSKNRIGTFSLAHNSFCNSIFAIFQGCHLADLTAKFLDSDRFSEPLADKK